MTYRQYRILKATKIAIITENKGSKKDIFDSKIVGIHDIKDLFGKTYANEIIQCELRMLKELDYVNIGLDQPGSAILIGINPKGYIAEHDYHTNRLFTCIRNIVIPAVVTIIVSLIVNAII